MPKSQEVWPVELVEAGYLDSGRHTTPWKKILQEYVWCDPYPDCKTCPLADCWAGSNDGTFCSPPLEDLGYFDPEDVYTWKGVNVLNWFRNHRVFDPSVSWTIEENLRLLERLRCRWPGRGEGSIFPVPWMTTGFYMTNSVMRLFDPLRGLDVDDHWRFTDSEPMYKFRTGIGCSNASTHLGMSMARALNFPARSVCMAHYHDDTELWIPYGPPEGERYRLDEGEWVRFLGDNFVADKWTSDPPHPGGGSIYSEINGIWKTASYITWDAEDSIPFNWFKSDTEHDYETCRAVLTGRQWPNKIYNLTMADETVRLIAAWPSTADFSKGEGFPALSNIYAPSMLAWSKSQHLIPLGYDRYAFILRNNSDMEFIVVDSVIESVKRQILLKDVLNVIEEPGRYRCSFIPKNYSDYIILEISEYWVNRMPPTATPEPTMTPSPIPTGIPLGVRLLMPENHFAPGDEFYLGLKVSNPGPPLNQIRLFIFLETLGNYYFWPSWSFWNTDSGTAPDNALFDLPEGQFQGNIIDSFIWPDLDSSAEGLHFMAALTDSQMSQILGQYDELMWGFE